MRINSWVIVNLVIDLSNKIIHLYLGIGKDISENRIILPFLLR